MMIDKKSLQWIRQNRFQIAKILEQLIDDRTKEIIDEEDDVKREKKRMWVKELRLGLSILRKTDPEKKEENFSGV